METMIHVYKGVLPSIVNNSDKMEITQMSNNKEWLGNDSARLWQTMRLT